MNLILEALDTAIIFRSNALENGMWTMDGNSLKLIEDALDVYDAQIEEATFSEWVDATNELENIIGKGGFFEQRRDNQGGGDSAI